MKSRVVLLFIGVVILWGITFFRAFYLQLVPNEKLQALKNRQFQTSVTLNSRRGAILDRNGRDLALSQTAYSLYADPSLLRGKRDLARKLAKELDFGFENVYGKIQDPDKRFVWIARFLDKDKADKIKGWKVRGLAFVEEWKRVYPNDSLLSSTIGFVGGEGSGLEGLEQKFQEPLQGNQKKIVVRRDARGRPLVAEGLLFVENPDGSDLKLTVDLDLQYVLENELTAALTAHEADSAVGLVLDAKTSAIVAIAGAPAFDANRALRVAPEMRRNRAVMDSFEQGSTMKTLVIAGALREKLLAPNKKYDCEDGVYKVGDRIIREADAKHAWKMLSVSEILRHSSNIGTTKIAFELGDDKLRKTLIDFGLGAKTGVDLPGEARGILHNLPWKPHLLSNVSFGHGISASPLQVANAYAAIANGGILNTPYIVQSLRDGETGEETVMEPKSIRRVLSTEDAAKMRMMLTGVTTEGGTGTNARVPGYLVAGKTGTAQKVNPHGLGYLQNAYISSFVGFIPAHDPKYVVYISVDNPKKGYYSSQVAAPVFSRVAGYAVRKAGVPPMILSEQNVIQARNEVKRPAAVKLSGTTKELIDSYKTAPVEVVPDLYSLSAREVIRKLRGTPLRVQVKGKGLVLYQIPSAGEPVPADKQITVVLE
ncbi:MAG: penicillin-binding protein [Pseudobdellovibrionaceae bacterium]